jgi:uncharacterized protein YggE
MRKPVILIALVAVLCSAGIAHAQQAAENLRTISTTGEAVVYVVPNEVIVWLGVETREKTLVDAKAANARTSALLLRNIKDLGIEEKNIQTDVMHIGVEYDSHASLRIQGYTVSRSYSVKLTDPKMLEAVVETAMASGANRLSGIQFNTTELRKHRDEARKMAMVAAKEKAIELAGTLGCTVGAPRTIVETGGGFTGSHRGGMYAQNVAQDAGGFDEGGQTMPLGQIAVRASVSVTFDLVPGQNQ